MLDQLKKIADEVKEQLNKIKNSEELADLEVRILGRKGELTNILRQLKDLSEDERKSIGQLANDIKNDLVAGFTEIKNQIDGNKKASEIDLTLPGKKFDIGHLHPISQVQYHLEDIFSSLGFIVEDGPDLESDFFNFEALNFAPDHPARDMQDAFYIKEEKNYDPKNKLLLRSQTSPVQIRAMKKHGAPLRVIVPGRCFRNESTDVRHEHTFYQLEGLMIDKNISIANMKSVLEIIAKKLYGPGTKVRFRPKFYPFVEPGVNGEVSCFLCQGKGCRLCKDTGWLEIFGAGMVHPNVLIAGGVDPKEYSGFAFGFGLNRLVMLKYGINDIRLFMSGDKRFLDQF
ncbi:MAG: phenylalanine--tRNA ligase subunit alpha [Patescibacteria group bacterium]|jgi:phenylalanyl-tRNA synthetase alpha chain